MKRVPALRFAGPLSGGEDDLRGAGAVRPDPRVPGERIPFAVAQGLVRSDAVLIAPRDLVALLVREELLDRISLLRVRDHPVPDALPGRVRVAPEHQGPDGRVDFEELRARRVRDRKSTRLNSSHTVISYAVFCLKKKKKQKDIKYKKQ